MGREDVEMRKEMEEAERMTTTRERRAPRRGSGWEDLTIVIVLDVTALSPPPTTVALAGHVSRSSIARAEC